MTYLHVFTALFITKKTYKIVMNERRMEIASTSDGGRSAVESQSNHSCD